METTSAGGFASRIAERVVSWLALALIVLAGVAVWQMGPEGRENVWNWIWRVTVWLVVIAALPWSATLLIERVLDAGSNWAAAALVAVYVLLSALIGVGLLTAWPASAWGWLAALAALGVGGTYNYLVLEYLAQRSGR